MTLSEAIDLFAPAILAAIATIATTWWGNRTADKNRSKTWRYEYLVNLRKERLDKLHELQEKRPSLDDAAEALFAEQSADRTKVEPGMTKVRQRLLLEGKQDSWGRFLEIMHEVHAEEVEERHKKMIRDWPKVRSKKVDELNEEIKKIDAEIAQFHR